MPAPAATFAKVRAKLAETMWLDPVGPWPGHPLASEEKGANYSLGSYALAKLLGERGAGFQGSTALEHPPLLSRPPRPNAPLP